MAENVELWRMYTLESEFTGLCRQCFISHYDCAAFWTISNLFSRGVGHHKNSGSFSSDSSHQGCNTFIYSGFLGVRVDLD